MIFITSFALLRLDDKLFHQQAWQRVVVDEAQNLKNPKSAQTRAILKLNSQHRLALTGTPIENRLLDLWSIFHFLNPGYLGSSTQFRKRFEKPIQRDDDRHSAEQLKRALAGAVPSGRTHHSEAALAVQKAFDQAGIGPGDLDLVELQDNTVYYELAFPEDWGLCEPGEAERLVDEYAADAPPILREDFYNSLLAAYTLEEVESQLREAGLGHLRVSLPSDRHWIATGTLSR